MWLVREVPMRSYRRRSAIEGGLDVFPSKLILSFCEKARTRRHSAKMQYAIHPQSSLLSRP